MSAAGDSCPLPTYLPLGGPMVSSGALIWTLTRLPARHRVDGYNMSIDEIWFGIIYIAFWKLGKVAIEDGLVTSTMIQWPM